MPRKSIRLPKRFPAGTKYIVEGAHSPAGVFHVTRRFVVLPSGRTVDVPLAPRTPPKRPAAPPNARSLLQRSRAQRAQVRAAL